MNGVPSLTLAGGFGTPHSVALSIKDSVESDKQVWTVGLADLFSRFLFHDGESTSQITVMDSAGKVAAWQDTDSGQLAGILAAVDAISGAVAFRLFLPARNASQSAWDSVDSDDESQRDDVVARVGISILSQQLNAYLGARLPQMPTETLCERILAADVSDADTNRKIIVACRRTLTVRAWWFPSSATIPNVSASTFGSQSTFFIASAVLTAP